MICGAGSEMDGDGERMTARRMGMGCGWKKIIRDGVGMGLIFSAR